MDKPWREMTDDELRADWRLWTERVKSATGWGASLAFADQCRRVCESELRERGVKFE